MKRIIIIAIAVLAAALLSTSCFKSIKGDVSVQISAQLEDWSGDIAEGLAYMEEGTQIKAIFGRALEAEGFEPTVQDNYVLRDQTDNKKAQEMVKAACEKANAEARDFSPKKMITVNVTIKSIFGTSNNIFVFQTLDIKID